VSSNSAITGKKKKKSLCKLHIMGQEMFTKKGSADLLFELDIEK
jgi:hypothetical protein